MFPSESGLSSHSLSLSTDCIISPFFSVRLPVVPLLIPPQPFNRFQLTVSPLRGSRFRVTPFVSENSCSHLFMGNRRRVVFGDMSDGVYVRETLLHQNILNSFLVKR